jgi:hypothetical protein
MDTDSAQLTRLNLPQPQVTYLSRLIDILRGDLGQQLVGVYLFGSAAYGEYEQGISDLDVQAVVVDALDLQTCRLIADHLTHDHLPCPARRLEFVIYRQQAVKPTSRHPQFELNFNTGGRDPDHFVTDPAHEASHWFLLDIAMGRALGQRLFGAEPVDVFGAISRLWQLEAIADSLNWHITHEMTSANNVLNACRGWRYAATGEQGSKRAGAVWALQQPQCPQVVEQAMQQRRQGGLPLDKTSVSELIEIVLDAVRTAIRSEH